MRENVFKEYRHTIHHANRTGVRATCPDCHSFDSMDYTEQGRRAAAAHTKEFDAGKTCIDCHKGVAHTLPPIEQNIGTPKVTDAGATAPTVADGK